MKIVKDDSGTRYLRVGRRWEFRILTHQWDKLFHPLSCNWVDFTFIDIGVELARYNENRFEARFWLLGIGIYADRWTRKHDHWRWPDTKEQA